jgi:C1A family cysteine protease
VHGHNYLSDWSPEEYDKLQGLKNMPLPDVSDIEYHEVTHEGLGAPTSWDWRAQGAVTPVKNQQSCGSCYGYAAAEVIESDHKIRWGGALTPMSTQQYVSCSSGYGNQACNGGWYFYCWDYDAVYSHATDASYPYVSGGGSVPACNNTNVNNGIYGVAYQYQVARNEAAIINAVYMVPQAVAVDAGSSYFQSYTSGILTNAALCGTALSHAVVTVGYGTSGSTNYWIVRNSWATSWGESGYVRIARGAEPGVCGINLYTAYAVTTA